MISREITAAIDKEIEKRCQAENVPGMALLLAQNGELIYEKCYGFRDVEQKLPVTGETIFGVASITKSLTALAVMILEDKKKLSVSDPVSQWLPELSLPDEDWKEQLKVHHLLTHTAGFPGMSSVNNARSESIHKDPDGEYIFGSRLDKRQSIRTVAEMMEEMAQKGYSPLGQPGEVFNYSNEAYALLQEIIERAGGKPYIQFVTAEILQPAGMKRSVFLTGDLLGRENVTELYAYKNAEKSSFFHTPSWWDAGEIYANGSLKSSAADMLKYLEIFRLDGAVESGRIVSRASIEKMATLHVTMPTGQQYGYGLQVGEEQELRVFGHGGSIKGVSSHMKVVKAQGITAVVLMNVADAPAEEMAMTAIRNFLGLPDNTIQLEKEEYPFEPEELEDFAAFYKSDEGQQAEVVFADGQLQLLEKEILIPLKRYSADSFKTPKGDKLKFLRGETAEVTAVFKGVRVLPKV